GPGVRGSAGLTKGSLRGPLWRAYTALVHLLAGSTAHHDLVPIPHRRTCHAAPAFTGMSDMVSDVEPRSAEDHGEPRSILFFAPRSLIARREGESGGVTCRQRALPAAFKLKLLFCA